MQIGIFHAKLAFGNPLVNFRVDVGWNPTSSYVDAGFLTGPRNPADIPRPPFPGLSSPP